MEDDNVEDISSHPYFVRAEFPFVFIPTTSTTGFTFSNNDTHVIDDEDEQTTTEFVNEKEGDHNEENDDDGQDKTELRISQPKYSKLLKDLDFSHTRMVDVTNLLSDETSNYLTPDENENQKKLSSDEKYQSLSSNRSSISSDAAAENQISSNSEKDNQTLTNVVDDIQNNLNNLSDIIQQASQMPTKENTFNNLAEIIEQVLQIPTEESDHERHYLEEDDDTNKQTTQNYDLNDNEQESVTASLKSNKNLRFTTQTSNSIQDENLSSIPRLNPNTNNRTENLDQTQEYPITWENLVNGKDAFIQSPSQPIDEIPTTPIKEQKSLSSSPKGKRKQHIESSPKQKVHHRSRQLSASSETDSAVEYGLHRSKQKQHSMSQPQLSIDDDLNDLNTHLKQVLIDQDQSYTTPSEILLRRLSNQQVDRTSPNRKKPHHHHQHRSTAGANDTWLQMLEKLEREHKERLENQQKQYEDYMYKLEQNMKQRFTEYLSTSNSIQESKSEILNESIHSCHTHNSAPIDSDNYQYRPLAKGYYSTNLDKRQTIGTNLSRSQSRENISNLRTELSTKHAKHISDLKLYYDHEIDELKSQLNRSKMGQTSSSSTSTRQSIETIERINNENIRLHNEMKEIRRSLKTTEEENHSLKRQLEELRDQLINKDLELKNSHRLNNDLEQQLNETHNIKERQDEKFRHVDRQALLYQEENEKITHDLNLTRERLLRLEERYRELENENKTFRQPPGLLVNENNNPRINDDLKYNSIMSMNIPTSREYGRFTLTTSKYSSSTVTTPREENHESGRYITNNSDNLFRYENSSRPLTRITDYINEKPIFPQGYVPPSRPHISPRRSPPNQYHNDQMPVRNFIDNPIKQSEQLEEKFDELLRKKRDLESRLNRIPTRGLTNTDRQLLDVLEREIDRVEQQISSVKLELRKMNILRTH